MNSIPDTATDTATETTASSSTPLLRAIGNVIHGGSRMATAEGRLVGPDGKLYAHASTTCFIFNASEANLAKAP